MQGTLVLVDDGVALDQLNAGQGIERGKIRITDRSGATAVVDLRFAATVDDVLAAINSNETINVTASTLGDSFQLVDGSGGGAWSCWVRMCSADSLAKGKYPVASR